METTRTSPGSVQDGTAWRIAKVSPDVDPGANGESVTLDEFSTRLQSTASDDVTLAFGDWSVGVANGVVTKITSVAA